MNGQPKMKKKLESAQNVIVRGGIERRCRKCQKIKSVNDFFPSLPSRCKECHTIETNKWKQNHLDKGREWSTRYRKNNPEKVKVADKEYKRKRSLLHGEEDKKHKAEYDKIYYQNNKEKKNKQGMEYYFKLKENGKIKEVRKKARIKVMNDPMKKLHKNISFHVWFGIKNNKNKKSVFDLLGYTVEDLKIHLENLFSIGMTWDNYGKWHVDHIIPVAVFNFTSPTDIDFKKCWNIKNLQPLWGPDNIRKGAKLDTQFQPSITI